MTRWKILKRVSITNPGYDIDLHTKKGFETTRILRSDKFFIYLKKEAG